MTKRDIMPPYGTGEHSRQAHVDLPNGSYERELGRRGFSGPATHMYHRNPPTAWCEWSGPHRPRAFDFNDVPSVGSPWEADVLFSNSACSVSVWMANGAMDHLVRNADGDTLLFVHSGTGEMYCDYGHLRLESGDYFVIPRGTMWRTAFDGPAFLLLIEATNASFGLPDKGLLGEHALFDPGVLRIPELNDEFRAQQGPGDWRLVIKRQNRLSTVRYPFSPLDAIGWKGTLMPVKVNVADIREVASHRYHLPPSAHTTFVSDRFVVATFCPRPAEVEEGALKVPFFHNNDDYDELVFFHRGDFFSREDMRTGTLTYHPSGVTHGPHPAAYRNAFKAAKSFLDEVAVNIDMRDPVDITPAAERFEKDGYVQSWSGYLTDEFMGDKTDEAR